MDFLENSISHLTDQYYQSEGRTDFESLMFKKVTSLINEVKNDSKNRKAFEAMLDNDLDGIMTNIRNEMPKLKELDYSILSYLIRSLADLLVYYEGIS